MQYRWGSNHVYNGDADGIKAHAWFKGVKWTDHHLQAAPWVPCLHSKLDSHYFEEGDESISDHAPSDEDEWQPEVTSAELDIALDGHPSQEKNETKDLLRHPYDMNKLEQYWCNIKSLPKFDEVRKQHLQRIIQTFGRKEKKRARDKVLRDSRHAKDILEVRKQLAFKGYSWRRMQRQRRLRVLGTTYTPSHPRSRSMEK